MARHVPARGLWSAALWQRGFRPFFLVAAIWAVVAMALWLVWLGGGLPGGFTLDPVDWHAHAMVFGFVPAVIAGFLLTAVPNWTGRLPIRGGPLAGLVLLWLAGRIATTLPLGLPVGAIVAIDLAFLAVFASAIAREIVVGRNWRNLAVLGPVGLIWAGQAMFHVEAAGGGAAHAGPGLRLALAATLFLVLLVGGRIVPAFTRTWLAKRAAPVPAAAGFGPLDAVGMGLAAVALVLWSGWPLAWPAGLALVAAGGAALARLARWQGHRSLAEPLVLVLHAGYALSGFALLALGSAALAPDRLPPAAALHLAGAGAIGLMCLAVMTRATLGHSGRALRAGRGTLAIYLAVTLGAVLRSLGALWSDPALTTAGGLAWAAAFALFLFFYGPILSRSTVP